MKARHMKWFKRTQAKRTGTPMNSLRSIGDYEYEELDESPQLSDQEIFDILIGRHE